MTHEEFDFQKERERKKERKKERERIPNHIILSYKSLSLAMFSLEKLIANI